MSSIGSQKWSVFCLFLASPFSWAQDSQADGQPELTNGLPYEVIVRPNETIGTLSKLHMQIEKDFFDKFNELNLDNDYDVQCYDFVPTGSHIRRRVCEPNFFIYARADNASDYGFALGGCSGCARPPPPILTPENLRFDTRKDFEILQEKLEEFYGADREFRSIGEALAKIKRRIENLSNNSK